MLDVLPHAVPLVYLTWDWKFGTCWVEFQIACPKLARAMQGSVTYAGLLKNVAALSLYQHLDLIGLFGRHFDMSELKKHRHN